MNNYEWVSGFNFQPDWGSNGVSIWLNFDEERYRFLLQKGKEKFPKMNCIRELLSFDAWYENRELYLNNLQKASKIIKELGLKFMPCYFNGWASLPNYGVFTAECIQKGKLTYYKKYLSDCLAQLQDSDVIMHDIANEPFNNTFDSVQAINKVMWFLKEMCEVIRSIDSRPITIGSQGWEAKQGTWSDIEYLAPLVDVFSLHSYNASNLPIEVFEQKMRKLLKKTESYGKPTIITESIWGAGTAEERKPFIESELLTYKKLKIGFLCHGLATSPVSDLHPIDVLSPGEDLYMAFLDENFEIRPYHDLFNKVLEE